METFTLGNLEKYKKIVELTTKAAERSHETERGLLLTEFKDTINMSRLGSKYKQVSIAKIGLDLAHIPTKDLYFFLSICKDAGKRANRYDQGFAKKYYWELKVQKDAR